MKNDGEPEDIEPVKLHPVGRNVKTAASNSESRLAPIFESKVEPEDQSFRRIIQFVKKRGLIVAATLGAGILCAFIANHLMHKLYTATARIEIVPDQSSQFRLEPIQSIDGGDDAERIDTEIQILESRTLALKTVQSLHLESNPDFLPLPDGHPWNLENPAVRRLLTDTFISGLNLQRLGSTSIVEVSATSKSPMLATLAVNSLIDNYVENSFEESYSSTAKISTWLNGQLNGLKQNLEKRQAQMIAYQRDLGIVGIDPKASILDTRLEELNKRLADAEVERMIKQAQLEALKSSSPDVVDAEAGPSNPALQSAKIRLGEFNAQRASMVQTFGPAYPGVKNLDAEINDLRRSISENEKAQIARAEKEFEAAQENENTLRKKVDDEEELAYSKGEKGAKYEFARRDYETARSLYDGLQERLEEAGIVAGLHATPIHIIDKADTPVSPSHPRKNLNLAIGAGVGFFVGSVIALLLEAMDINLKTVADIEEALQIPLLAAVPAANAESLHPFTFKEHAYTTGATASSRVAEAMRSMRTSILLSTPGGSPKLIMVASARPSEGKSTVAALIAITFAMNGSRVLLMDADLRRPSLHTRFKVGNDTGLAPVLSGQSNVQDGIQEWPHLSKLHLMTSGPLPTLPSELLGSTQMENLLLDMRSKYDFIIVDTPPVLAVTDACVLGRLSDATIMVVRYGAVQRQVVQRSIDLLDRSGGNVLGVVINDVDFRAPGYSEYYGVRYRGYSGERESERRH